MSPVEKEKAVLAVLTDKPTGPSEIGRLVGQPWSCDGIYGYSAAITPVLRRIGALRHQGGKYTRPAA